VSRPAKTIRQHLLEGTVPQGKPDRPSNFVGGRPRFPKHLCLEAKCEFKRVCQLLEARRTLTAGDFATLAVYAEVFARWIQAKAAIGKELMVEVTFTDSNGKAHTSQRLNPLLKVAENCEGRLLALAKTLGLTPVDREKAKPTKDIPDSDELVPGTLDWYDAQQRLEKQKTEPVVIPAPTTLEEEENANV
jgi:P27 family predicted phage terminase small subunit